MSVAEHIKSAANTTRCHRSKEKIWTLIYIILGISDPVRSKTLAARKAARRLVRELALDGFANPTLQNKLYKETAMYNEARLGRRKELSPEEYLQTRLAPYHLLYCLSDKVLDQKCHIRIGRNWVKQRTGLKRKIRPRDLSQKGFRIWLRSETHKSISQFLECDPDPLDNCVSWDRIEHVQIDRHRRAGYRPFRFDRSRFWDVRDPERILECFEERGLWKWRGQCFEEEALSTARAVVQEMKAASTPQTKRYLASLEKLIASGTDPESLEDRELAANIKISSQRIRQLRHNLKPYLSRLWRTSSPYEYRSAYAWL